MKWRIPSQVNGPGALEMFSARRRILRALLSTGLLAGLLGTPTAVAVEPAPPTLNVREQIVSYWETGGRVLKIAAERALVGDDDAVQKFLDQAAAIQLDDNKVETARLIMTGGAGVRKAAEAAIVKSPAELEAFLLYGYEQPLDDDRKVEIGRMVDAGGRGVREAGTKALLGTFADREEFLNKGQYAARKDDNRVEVARMTNTGGPNVRAAAEAALSGTPDDIVEFLEIGQFTARNRDQEHASIAELVKQAQAAGKQAADATKAAEDATTKAVDASNLAKVAAQSAAAQAELSKDKSEDAAISAEQAADAARAAAEAAQVAIGSADAANRAARRAALAAAQTAAAAAAAADAATKAYNAAIAAAGDASKAKTARESAANARAAAQAASTSAVAAENAGLASAAAAIASDAAKGASVNANAAATAAEQANAHADAAGVNSDAARQAAAEARRHATIADRAADRSAELARSAASAAYAARDTAKSAAAHANKAADYAEDAASHAGDSATYADQAKKNADAAKAAAATADAAVTKAKEIFELARRTEAADLATRTEGGLERANSMKITSNRGISVSASSQVHALSLYDTATVLAQEAARPDVDIQATAAKGRQLAMQAMKVLGPWQQEAAARALAGSDQDVLDYLRTRWKEANHNNTRQRVVDLSTLSPYPSVRAAAAEALKGTPEQIEAFNETGQYEAGRDDMRIAVARLTNTGGPNVRRAAEAAILDGKAKTLATFLQIGQYGERLTDEKVITARLTNTGGPEVQAAANIALAGPPELIHEFVTTGQYMAQRKDNLAAHHVHQVDRLIAEGSLVAARAQENASRAAYAAAVAEGASTEAAQASAEADESKAAADRYAANAKTSADAATQSAADAAASASTARNAADRAAQDAAAAESSASQAAFSASYARSSAQKADKSADQARASALAAGKSAAEAEADAKTAWTATRTLAEKEAEEARRQAAEEREQEEEVKPKRICIPHPTRETMAPIMACVASPGDSMISVRENDPFIQAVVWELTGLNDIKACIENPTALDCVMAVVGVTPWGKLKLVTKIDDGIAGIKALRSSRRSVACLTGVAHSFPAGTKVLMANGTSRPIEQIQPGELVTASDPVSGETGPRTVTRTIHTPDDRNFTDVILTDGSTLTSTSHHLYWSENDQTWKNASDLKAGDTLRTPQNNTATIAQIRDWRGLQDAYDLTVDDLHTYYVSTGTTNLLVHNTDGECPKWVSQIFTEIVDEWITTGVIRDSKGNRIPNLPERIVSSRDSDTTALVAYLKKIGYGDPRQTGFFAETHAETKLAYKMLMSGVEHATVVINNNKGVCKGRDTCSKLVEAILPEGHTLTVHYPGKGSPEIITGKGPGRQ
ncbi:DddA-like double-stranded DNA deaminase toxin [Streptomyces sp. NPDC058326]|uniref:DddA-like double-stranded DNA deaminase toxin n=1 Tax=Streptomyces sp. NPDC058326 TaxID=3346447 RepID=UPI0036E1A29D